MICYHLILFLPSGTCAALFDTIARGRGGSVPYSPTASTASIPDTGGRGWIMKAKSLSFAMPSKRFLLLPFI